MRSVIGPAAAAGLLLLSGCAHDPARVAPAGPAGPGAAATNAAAAEPRLIVTPEFGLHGKVVLANVSLRFVVLNFPIGQIPAVDQRMNIYRRGLKVGEVKVNAQTLDDNVTADIVAGEAAVGDSVRDR
jgi:hypothetical protein